MRTATSELLSMIGAMQTLVANFPMGILSSIKAKTYTSSIDFIMDCLSAVGVGNRDIIDFILTDLLNVKIDIEELKKQGKDQFLDNTDVQDSKFIQILENAFKSLIAAMLAELLSCSIHPHIPESAFTHGVSCPLKLVDPDSMLNICPTSREGLTIYDVSSEMTPDLLVNTHDFNAFLWYCLYKEPGDWKNKDNIPICTINGEDFTKIRFTFNIKNEKLYDSVEGKPKSLYALNKEYLDSIKIFNGRALISYFIDFLFTGVLPSAMLQLNMTETAIQGSLDNIIKNIIINDDQEIDNCFYSFSNEDWVKLLEEHELYKFNAIKSSNGDVLKVNHDAITEDLLTSSKAALNEQKTNLTSIGYDVMVTAATDTMSTVGLEWALDSEWIINITSLLVTPFVRCLFSPQVMSLIIMNFKFAGLIDFTNLNDISFIMDFFKKKILGVLRQLAKMIKDYLVKALLDLFEKYVLPLIEKYVAQLLLERIEDWTILLQEALDCVALGYGFGATLSYRFGNTLTQIDNVNYADITPQKITPTQNIC